MKKSMYFVEYVLVRLAEALFRVLPRSVALKLGDGLGWALSIIIHKRNKLIMDNLSHAFPEKSEEEKQRITRAVWRNIGRTAVEFVRVSEVIDGPVERFVETDGLEHFQKAIAQGKGVVLLTMHFANWELTGILAQLYSHGMTAIARPMHNPYVEKWLQESRRATGMEIILHRQAVRAALKCLKAKKVIGMLADQNLYTGGEFVDFFGRPAATTTLPAILHIRTGAPVMITYTLREGDRFRVVYLPPIKFPHVADESEKVHVYTQVYTKHSEDIIRKYPENWFWIHNRWKRKPE